MKKLLALMLVLGMASSANAIIIELGAGGVTNGAGVDLETDLTVVEVVSDTDAEPYVRYLFAPDVSMLDATNVVATSNAGTAPSILDYGDALGPGTHTWEIQAGHAGNPPLTSIVAGIQFDVDIAGVYGGQLQLLTEDLGTVLDTVTIVPEPATMLLVGLGGFFLRRRK